MSHPTFSKAVSQRVQQSVSVCSSQSACAAVSQCEQQSLFSMFVTWHWQIPHMRQSDFLRVIVIIWLGLCGYRRHIFQSQKYIRFGSFSGCKHQWDSTLCAYWNGQVQLNKAVSVQQSVYAAISQHMQHGCELGCANGCESGCFSSAVSMSQHQE